MRIAAICGGLVIACGALAPESPGAGPAGRVFTVAGGHAGEGAVRVGRPATESSVRERTVLGLPGGGFLFDDLLHSRVLRVDANGVLRAFAGNGRNGVRGDDGPAVDARIWGAADLALRADGSVAIADDIGDRIRLVTPAGVMQTLTEEECCPEWVGIAATADNGLLVANSERDAIERVAADGSRSVAWQLPRGLSPAGIAVAPDGTLFSAVYGEPPRLLVRHPDGSVATLRSPFFGTQLALMTDGSVLGATGDGEGPDALVERVTADGNLSVVAGNRARNQGFDGDGESPASVAMGPRDVSLATDGGLLIAGEPSIRYVAPEQPQHLAVAVTRPTLTSPRTPRVALALTLPARVSITLRRHGREAARQDLEVPAGDSSAQFSERLSPGAYTVRVVARDDRGRTATDRQVVFLGGRLDDSAALQAANQVIEDLNAMIRGGGRVPGLHSCRRVSAARVDCPEFFGGLCQGVVAVTLRRDGLPYLRRYDGGLEVEEPCRFRRRPRWLEPAYPARPL